MTAGRRPFGGSGYWHAGVAVWAAVSAVYDGCRVAEGSFLYLPHALLMAGLAVLAVSRVRSVMLRRARLQAESALRSVVPR